MFIDYYRNFLGYSNGTDTHKYRLCKSHNRDKPINKKFVYRIIITKIMDKLVISISPNINVTMMSQLIFHDNSLTAMDDILHYLKWAYPELRITKMYRMSLPNQDIEKRNDIEQIENIEETDVIHGRKDHTFLFDDKLMKCMFKDNDTVVGYCKISDIDYSYGNVVIWVNEQYRNRGLGTRLLKYILFKCKQLQIEPVYVVNSENIPSIRLAYSVGFKINQEEIIACEIIE